MGANSCCSPANARCQALYVCYLVSPKGALGGMLLTLFYKQGNAEVQRGYVSSLWPHR